MDLLLAFAAYAADFEQTFTDDDWGRLERHFHEDAEYRVENGPLACVLRGRSAIFAGMRRSLEGFDRRCDARELRPLAPPECADDRVVVRWAGTYRVGTLPPLRVAGTQTAEYRGDRILHLVDVYDRESIARYAEWLSRAGSDLDPSYR
jgi:hypothetical protein